MTLLKLRSERRKADVGFEAQNQNKTTVRLKNEAQYYRNKMLRIDLLQKDPGYNADYQRLGRAIETDDPNFASLKAEFNAKYFPPGEEHQSESQAA
jgi:hypothetical protein